MEVVGPSVLHDVVNQGQSINGKSNGSLPVLLVSTPKRVENGNKAREGGGGRKPNQSQMQLLWKDVPSASSADERNRT